MRAHVCVIFVDVVSLHLPPFVSELTVVNAPCPSSLQQTNKTNNAHSRIDKRLLSLSVGESVDDDDGG